MVLVAGTLGATSFAGTVPPGSTRAAEPGSAAQRALAANAPNHDDERDHKWKAADVVPITLADSGSKTSSRNVVVDDSTVTITAPGTYQLSGTLSDGQVVVDTDAPDLVRLILNKVNITNGETAALKVASASKVMVVLAANSRNSLTAGAEDWAAKPAARGDADVEGESDAPGAALFSKANLTIAGTGSLTATGNINDGIASKDGLVIDAGTITVDAADDGIRGKDYLVVNGGTVTVDAGGDGLKSDNDNDATKGYVSIVAGTVEVDAAGDAVAATTDVITTGGTLAVRSGGGSGERVAEDDSAKGVKGGVSVVIGDGEIDADCAEDAINSDTVIIDGGWSSLATGDDGVHADSALTVSGGEVTVAESNEGLEALQLTISGGTVDVTAANDGLNASQDGISEVSVAPDAFVLIDGGDIRIRAGDDGIDSNGKITIQDGTLVDDTDYDGIDANGNLVMTGGTVVINGPSANNNGQNGLEIMGKTTIGGGTLLVAAISVAWSKPGASDTGWLYATLDERQPAGTVIQLVYDDEVIASYRTPKAMRSILFASDQITNGERYEVYVGGRVSGTGIGGMYAGGTLSGADKVMTVTAGKN